METVNPRVSMRHLRAFVTVAREGNQTKAAQLLSVTQAALSLTIQTLEEDLSVKLFDRSTRRLELTQAAVDFLPIAERLLRDFDGALREMRALGAQERGAVAVAAVPSIMALAVLEPAADYMHDFPGIDLFLREDDSGGVYRRILSGDVDFGISSMLMENDELTFEPVLADRFCVVSPAGHKLSASHDDVTWSEVAKYRIVGFSTDLGMQYQLTTTASVPLAIRKPQYRVSNTASIEALISRCDGVSVMSALAAQRAPLTNLHLRLLHKPIIHRVGIVRRKGRSLSSAAAELLIRIRRQLESLAALRGVSLL
jgi:DNA-binding transcriptional LysR family regulator